MAGEAGFPRPFGDYLLLSSFGRGGMGEVFLAKRTAFEGVDRLCVIKTLRGELAEDPEYINRFLDEARVVVQLHHATICQVFDAGMVGSDYFMAMEYISGTNLRDLGRQLVQAGTALEPGIALYLLSETLDALAYAHRLAHAMTGEKLGIIHRDVSPHNVMLSFEGEVKLIDFGLAESSLKEEHTASAIVLGKVAYMAPEQARGEAVDPSCDQFAAAVMGYELLVHERFYGALKTHEIWQIVGVGNFAPRLFDTLDPEMQQILSRGWDAQPSRRYPSCEAMREAIDDFRALRYPRVGKKQARALMQTLYQQRIHEERQLLASYAEISSPNSLKGKLEYWEARSTSQVATHGVASTEGGLGPVEMTVSSSSSGPVTTPSDPPAAAVASQVAAPPLQPSDEALAEPSGRSSTLTRQEQAFVEAGTAPDATARLERDGGPVAVASAPASSRGPMLVGAVIVGLLAVIGVLLTEQRTAGDPVLTDPSPAATTPNPTPAVSPPPAIPDAGEPEPEPEPASEPEPAVIAVTSDDTVGETKRQRRLRRQSRRGSARQRASKAAPVDDGSESVSEKPPAKAPDASDSPPAKEPVNATADTVVKPKPKPKPKPLASLSTRELKRRIERCDDKCARRIVGLKGYGSSKPAAVQLQRTLMVNCLKDHCRE